MMITRPQVLSSSIESATKVWSAPAAGRALGGVVTFPQRCSEEAVLLNKGHTWDFTNTPIHTPDPRAAVTQPAIQAGTTPKSFQAKLEIGMVDDPLESEADRVADQMMRMPVPGGFTAARQGQINRKCAACDDDKLQRRTVGPRPAVGEVPAVVDEVRRSPGQPLDASSRAYFEPRFGADFSCVRVHTDARAAESASGVDAIAYTAGHHIVFGKGAYAPTTGTGRRLLAHELTHVVQQATSPAFRVQRDKAGAKGESEKAEEIAPERKEAQAQVSEIERQWTRVKRIAGAFAETQAWIGKGDEVVALVREHTARALDAIAAHDMELVNDFKFLVEGDLIAYRYVIWHTFVYQNLARLRSSVNDLISSFDSDQTHYSGRKDAEDAVRQLKRFIDGLRKDSATRLAALRTDYRIKIRAASSKEISVTVTSAANREKRAALEKEIHGIIDVQVAVQVILEHTNKFLRNATKEGFWYAVEAVKEYYEVRQGIIDSSGGPDVDDSQEAGEPAKERRERRAYQCTTKCQQQCPSGVEGTVSGTSSQNCAEATRTAKSGIRRGCYPRHCNCKDTEGFIGKGTQCENHKR